MSRIIIILNNVSDDNVRYTGNVINVKKKKNELNYQRTLYITPNKYNINIQFINV